MNMIHLLLVILTMVTYYFFSDEMFKFCAEIEGEKIRWFSRFIQFLIVYIWFVVASLLELPLIANWFVFLLILGVEIRVAFGFDFVTAYSISLFCITLGLTVSIFFRSFSALFLNEPLSEFNNSLFGLRGYPVMLGFAFMAFLLFTLRRRGLPQKLKRMLQYRKSLTFYFQTEILVYIFLNAQLMLFSLSTNEMGVKLWGIKSSLFSGLVLVITIAYSLRVASLSYYRQKQNNIRDQLIRDKEDMNKLWTLAYTDMLTNCNNRQLLNIRLEEYARYGGSITLAFIDVNGLKKINDQYGHIEGDRYLMKVAQILSKFAEEHKLDLFRYGGDEFIVMSNSLQEEKLKSILEKVNEVLKVESTQHEYSISYGVVHGECEKYSELIRKADEYMYQQKKQSR